MSRLMTPAEYADAYHYWQQQDTKAGRIDVADLIEERTFWLRADVERMAALRRFGDTPGQQAERQRALLADEMRRAS